jgi:hypothetical protein
MSRPRRLVVNDDRVGAIVLRKLEAAAGRRAAMCGRSLRPLT